MEQKKDLNSEEATGVSERRKQDESLQQAYGTSTESEKSGLTGESKRENQSHTESDSVLARDYIRRIIMAVNVIDSLYDVGARWRGVKTNTLYLLYALDDDNQHTQKSISDEWLIPRTTLNTIIKECKADGYITLSQIPGHKRDLQIDLTEKGRAFMHEVLEPMYKAEDTAIGKTVGECGPEFIAGLERFGVNLADAFRKLEEHR